LVKQVEGEAPMFDKLELTRMAQSLATYSGARMAVIARNVANADTPGFKAKDMPAFSEVLMAASPAALPTPDVARGREAPNGNSVSLEAEMVKSVEARQSQEMALAIYRATSDVIRASLGRPR
jgi:flagellar basal-body rod protein FlgB